MTTRRTLLQVGTGGLVSLAALGPALAQPQRRLPMVGLVLPNVPVDDMIGTDPVSPLVRGFLHGLRELGWIEGSTVAIERRSAGGRPERAPALVADLLSRGVDVLVVGGARWLQDAARQATAQIPIVALFPGDPVEEGLIASLARPGNNLTGVTSALGPEFTQKQVQLLQEAFPGMKRVAFLGIRSVLEPHRAVSAVAGVMLVPVPVDAAIEYETAFATIRREGVDALLVAGGPPNVVNAQRIAAFVLESGLPAMFGFREAVDAGGLMSYGPSFVGLFRQKARLVAKFLAGDKPGDIPTERPTTFELIVNLKAASALGLTLPPAILLRADEVIE